MAGGIVDIGFDAKVINANTVDQLLAKLEKIKTVYNGLGKVKGGGGGVSDGLSETNKILVQTLDLDKKIADFRSKGFNEAVKYSQELQNQLKSGITLTEVQRKQLEYLVKSEQISAKKSAEETAAANKQLMKLEEIKQLRDKIMNSGIVGSTKGALGLDLRQLEKGTNDPSYNQELNKIKEKFNAAILYEQKFRELEKADMNKAHSEALRMNKEIDAAEKKRLSEKAAIEKSITEQKIKQAQMADKQSYQRTPESQRSFDVYSQAEKDSKTAMDKLHSQALQMNKTYDQQKKAVSDTTKSINDNTKATGENEKSVKQLANAYLGLRAAMMIKQQITQAINELSAIDKAMYNLGTVAGKTSWQIEEMKYNMIELATAFPQTGIEIAGAVDTVVRAGKTYAPLKKSLFLLETPKVA